MSNVSDPGAQLSVYLDIEAKHLERSATQLKLVCHTQGLILDKRRQYLNGFGAGSIDVILELVNINLAAILSKSVPKRSQSALFVIVGA